MTAPVTAAVHSWDVSTGVDGPGTRFVLFLAGCPLRCQYCQNPDSWHMRDGRRMTLDEVLHELSTALDTSHGRTGIASSNRCDPGGDALIGVRVQARSAVKSGQENPFRRASCRSGPKLSTETPCWTAASTDLIAIYLTLT